MSAETSPAKLLSLVIPCFNEEKSLLECVEKVLSIETPELGIEIVIVDDCSSDGSVEVAQDLVAKHPQVKLLMHEANLGKGAAIRTGLASVSGAYVGIQDADLEYNPENFHVLLQPILDGKADVVFGSRYLRPDSRRVLSYWHTWMNKKLTTVSNMFTNLDISDMETCYKLFRREVIDQIEIKENRFGFEPEVTAKIARMGCRVYEVAIDYVPRTYDEGKKIGWKDGIWALYCILSYGAPTAPVVMQLVVYGFVGFISAVINVSAFTLFLNAGVEMTVSVVVAFALAAAANYLLCIAILFRHNARWNTVSEILVYVLAVLAMAAVDYGVFVYFVDNGVSPVMAKTIASVSGFFGNFITRRFLVFPEPTLRRI